ncbi:MAG: HEPN domain-containing protein [Verrucomicrobiota bacterium]|jgi:HEPN domain-containing protein
MADNLARLTRDWLTKATHDLQNAQIVSAAADAPLDTAIYHCQQAAEKSLKGWLAWRGITLVKTHDLIQLVAEAADVTPDFVKFEQAAEILTPYVSAFRYPGLTDEPMPSRAEFDAALQHAQAIYDFVLNLLPKEAKP